MSASPAAQSPPGGTGRFEHEAVLYRDQADYAVQVGRFVSSRVARGSPVLVAVPARQRDWLWDVVDHGGGPDWQMVDMSDLGANPARIIPAVRAFFDAHAGEPLSVVGESAWTGSPEQLGEMMVHEALVNVAFAGEAATFLCPYDTGRLPEQVLDQAARTHPLIRRDGQQRISEQYTDPGTRWVQAGQLDRAPARAAVMQFDMGTLLAARRLVCQAATRAGLSGERTDELTLAVWEIATNSVYHAGGTGTLSCWTDPTAVLCQITDTGHLSDPLAGRRRPAGLATSGWGLYLANQLVDLLQISTGPQGTTTRLRVDR